MVLAIVKRDGSVQDFDASKILRAVTKAFATTPPFAVNAQLVQDITDQVVARLQDAPTIEDVQDAVERVLMSTGCHDVARHYILWRKDRAEHRELYGMTYKVGRNDVDIPWGPLGFVTYKRTYSRRLTDDAGNDIGGTEDFPDTIRRVLNACQNQLHCGFTPDELERAWDHMTQLRGSVAGRFLWQLGTKTVDKLGLASTQNCAFTAIDRIECFTWIFDMLMLGCGVGFSIQKEHVDKLPPVLSTDVKVTRLDTADADFIVPDSREGWVSLLGATLRAFFVTGKSFTYSTILVRSAGKPIRGFGGIASGPEDLCKGLADLCSVVGKRAGQLRPIDCLDVVNIIAAIVVSGNVRRSALLAIGDCDDVDFLKAKRWDLGGVPNWRAMSNNSVACDDIDDLPEEFWAGFEGRGETYGMINMKLAKSVGRLVDGDKYPDADAVGFNPCAEQSLANWETCCLAEIFLPQNKTYEELKDCALILYRICKKSLSLPCHHDETAAIVARNYRMGVGVSGYLQATAEQKAWLPQLYEDLRAYDVAYSAENGLPVSRKLTTVKPSGTLSLLPGVTPGWHPALFKYYIRRIRMPSNHALIELCRAHGYDIEFQVGFDGTPDRKTSIVSFPCKTPDGVPLADELSAIDELEIVKHLQTVWSDNAVSNTIYFRPHELDDIKAWLRSNYSTSLKTVSFMLQYDHGFAQAPYSPISEEEFVAMSAGVKPITSSMGQRIDLDDADELDASLECPGGACPLR